MLPVAAVVVLAFAARLTALVHVGVVSGTKGYDQSVYYTAADALLHGQIPYRGDFVFLHPPVMVLLGTPFALLGAVTSAATGFFVENLTFAALSALAAGLVVVTARRAGAPTWAGLAGGVFYATWVISLNTGSAARLEPLGDLVLVLVFLAVGRVGTFSARQLCWLGVGLGVLVNVKLWWAAPLLVLFVVAVLPRSGVRRSASVLAGAVATSVVLDLPFLLLSGGHMWTSVVGAQLGRPAVQWVGGGEYGRLATSARLEQSVSAGGAVGALPGLDPADVPTVVHAVTVAACVLVVLVCVLALRHPLGRVAVPVLAVQAGVLLATPVFFTYYADFLGISLALVIAAAGAAHGRSATGAGWRAAPSAVLALGAACTALAFVTAPVVAVRSPGPASLARATAGAGCIVADTPRVLIALDALDRSFEEGCRNLVDVQGVGYGAGPDASAERVGPAANRAWRRTIVDYLRSGDAVGLGDPGVTAPLPPRLRRAISEGEVLVRTPDFVVRRSPTPDR